MSHDAEQPAKTRRLSLRKNFTWALAGNFVYALCHVGILFVIKTVGSLEMVGLYALATSLCVPVFLLTNLQLRTLQTTDTNREHHFSDYAGVRAIMTPLAFLILAVIAFSGHYALETAYVILALAFAKSIEAASELCYGACQQHERLDYVSRSLCLKGMMTLVLTGSTIWLTGSLVVALLVVATGWLLLFFLFDFRHVYELFREDQKTEANIKSVWKELSPRWSAKTFKHIALTGLPLGIGGLLLAGADSIPNVYLEWKFGERELGVFALLLTLTYAGIPIINALGQAVTPRLAQHYADEDVVAFQTVMIKAVAIGVLFGLTGVVFTMIAGNWVLELLFGEEGAEYWTLLMVLVSLAPIKYGFRFFGNGLTATRRFNLVLRFQIIGLLVLIMTLFVCGTQWGVMGVAVAIFISSAIRSTLFAVQTYIELRRLAKTPADIHFFKAFFSALHSMQDDVRSLIRRVLSRSKMKSVNAVNVANDISPISSVKR